ncbi:uncharacterized protein AKAME5_001426500 [Lates japonicus]|uniref:Uncharacterized protein n=1 Tax=Lates japonicus TaxID=270547 RepID=A0AAD3MYL0_LATJO|nr:uncharacterized protein AKAME5_001426500 [Lates japonicus]
MEEEVLYDTGVPMGSFSSQRREQEVNACPSGWWQNRAVQGQWSAQDHLRHVNVWELQAVHMSLKHFLSYLKGKHVLVRQHLNRVPYQPPKQHQWRKRSYTTQGVPMGSFSSRRETQQMPVFREYFREYSIYQGRGTGAKVDFFASEVMTHCPLSSSLAEETSPSMHQDALAARDTAVLLFHLSRLGLTKNFKKSSLGPGFGLGCMFAVELEIASLIVHLNEALRLDARCPRPQCQVTDDFRCRGYDTAVHMCRIESCRRTLSSVPVKPGELAATVGLSALRDCSVTFVALLTCPPDHLRPETLTALPQEMGARK